VRDYFQFVLTAGRLDNSMDKSQKMRAWLKVNHDELSGIDN